MNQVIVALIVRIWQVKEWGYNLATGKWLRSGRVILPVFW